MKINLNSNICIFVFAIAMHVVGQACTKGGTMATGDFFKRGERKNVPPDFLVHGYAIGFIKIIFRGHSEDKDFRMVVFGYHKPR